MLVFRTVIVLVALLLGGLAIAWMVTGDRKYLQIAWRIGQFALVLGVILGLLYVFERILLI